MYTCLWFQAVELKAQLPARRNEGQERGNDGDGKGEEEEEGAVLEEDGGELKQNVSCPTLLMLIGPGKVKDTFFKNVF